MSRLRVNDGQQLRHKLRRQFGTGMQSKKGSSGSKSFADELRLSFHIQGRQWVNQMRPFCQNSGIILQENCRSAHLKVVIVL